MKQEGRSVVEHGAKFQAVAARLDWDEEPLMRCFYQGLREDVKDELAKEERPEHLSVYIAMAVRIDQRLYERRRERARNTRGTGKMTRFVPWKKRTTVTRQYIGPIEIGVA